MFGLSKGFGLEKILQAELYSKFPEQKIVIDKLVVFANNYLLQETQGGLIAGIGLAILLFIVIRLLSNIENTFNTIWGVKKPRSMIRKFTDYLSLTLICPILLILAESITIFIAAEITIIAHMPPHIHAFITTLIPYVIVWILFTFIYFFLPNTEVKIKPAVNCRCYCRNCFYVRTMALYQRSICFHAL